MNENDVIFLNPEYGIMPLAGFDEPAVSGSVVGFKVSKLNGPINPTLLSCKITNSKDEDVTETGAFYITSSTGDFYITVTDEAVDDLYTVNIYDEDVLVYQNMLEIGEVDEGGDTPAETDPSNPGEGGSESPTVPTEPGEVTPPENPNEPEVPTGPEEPTTPEEPTVLPGYVKYVLQKLDHYGVIMQPIALPNVCSILREQVILNGVLTSIFVDRLPYQQKEDCLNAVLDRFAEVKTRNNDTNYLRDDFPYRGINHLKNKTYEERKRFMLMFEFCIMFANPDDREAAYLKYKIDDLLKYIPESEHETVKKLIEAVC